MEELTNNIPMTPDASELEAEKALTFLPEDEWMDVDVSNDWLDVTEEFQRPKWTLAYNGIPFAPLGGLHSLNGLPGHGKTMTFTMLMVAILKGQYGDFTYELGEFVENPKVLYIDTEMEKGNTQLVNLRVYSMMGWSFGVPHDEFRIIMLRETEKAIDRWRKILKAIDTVKPTVCFIDGMLDVVNDFNDNKECQEIIYKCMKMASHFQMSVWGLVHLNPNGAKAVGHMGSIMERKITDGLKTSKEKDALTGDVVFTISQTKARGKDLPDIKFRVFDDINSFGVPRFIDLNETQQLQQSEADKLDAIMKKYVPIPGSISQTELQKQIKQGERIGSRKAYDMIIKAESLQIIEKACNGKFMYINHDPLPQPEEMFNETPY